MTDSADEDAAAAIGMTAREAYLNVLDEEQPGTQRYEKAEDSLVQDDVASLKRKIAEMQELIHEERRGRRAEEKRAEEERRGLEEDRRARRAAEQRAEEVKQQLIEFQQESVRIAEEYKRLVQACRTTLQESDRNSPTLNVEAALRQPIALGLGDAVPNVPSSCYVHGLAPVRVVLWENVFEDLGLANARFGGDDLEKLVPQSIFNYGDAIDKLDLGMNESTTRQRMDRSSIAGVEHIVNKFSNSPGNISITAESVTVSNTRVDVTWQHSYNGTCVNLLPEEFKRPSVCPRRELQYGHARYVYDNPVVEQLFGYMVVGGHKYGLLCSGQYLWCFRRDDDEGILEISNGFSCLDAGDKAINNVRVAMLQHCQKDPQAIKFGVKEGSLLYDRFCSTYMSSGRNFDTRAKYVAIMSRLRANFHDSNRAGLQSMLPLGPDDFIIGTPLDESYETLYDGSFSHVARMMVIGIDMIVKTQIVGCSYSDLTDKEARMVFENEASIYAAIKEIQGDAVPWLLFAGEFGEGRYIIVLNYCGVSLEKLYPPPGTVPRELVDRARKCVERFHSYGLVHGDLARRNFLVDEESGHVTLIDFGKSFKCDRDKPSSYDLDANAFEHAFGQVIGVH